MALLEVRNITKIFGGLVAVRDLSLDIREGEILGLIGPKRSREKHTFQYHQWFYSSQ